MVLIPSFSSHPLHHHTHTHVCIRGLAVSAEKSVSKGIPVPEFLLFLLQLHYRRIFLPARLEVTVGSSKPLANTAIGQHGRGNSNPAFI